MLGESRNISHAASRRKGLHKGNGNALEKRIACACEKDRDLL
jgi:hypothetical protein